MKLEVNIEKKHFFAIFGVILILAGIFFVNGAAINKDGAWHDIKFIQWSSSKTLKEKITDVSNVANSASSTADLVNSASHLRSKVKGTKVYSINTLCSGSGGLSLNSQCSSAVCSQGQGGTMYFSCSGTCFSSSSRSCNNVDEGWLVA